MRVAAINLFLLGVAPAVLLVARARPRFAHWLLRQTPLSVFGHPDVSAIVHVFTSLAMMLLPLLNAWHVLAPSPFRLEALNHWSASWTDQLYLLVVQV